MKLSRFFPDEGDTQLPRSRGDSNGSGLHLGGMTPQRSLPGVSARGGWPQGYPTGTSFLVLRSRSGHVDGYLLAITIAAEVPLLTKFTPPGVALAVRSKPMVTG